MHLIEYKVWVHIEKRVDPGDGGEDTYEDVGLPDCLGRFETFKLAAVHIRSLPGWEHMFPGTSDYREEEVTP